MTYKEQLLDPRWQKKRLKIFERDSWTCQAANCGCSTKQLQVHHTEYLNVLAWEYPDDMLITLCTDCHNLETGRGYLEINLARTLRMRGFLVSDLLAFSCLIDTDENYRLYLLNSLRQIQNG